MIGPSAARESVLSAPAPFDARSCVEPSVGGTAAMIDYFLDRDQNDFFCFLRPGALAVIPLVIVFSTDETLLWAAAATTGLPALAAAWLALASSGRTKSIER